MAYNAVSVGTISGKREHLFGVKALSGGFCEDKYALSDSQTTELMNMEFEGGYLTSRYGLREIPGLSGKFHSRLSEPFFENVLLHCGNSVFAFDGKEIKVIKDNLPDCDSVFLTMNSCAYLYTKERKIYEITKEFVCEEKKPYVPIVAVLNDNFSGKYEIDQPVNMMTKRIKLRLYHNTTEIHGSSHSCNIPFKVDNSQDPTIYINDVCIPLKYWNYESNRNTLHLTFEYFQLNEGDCFDIEFAMAEDEKFEEYFSKIYDSKIAFTYGGTSGKGTRAFLTGCDKYPGWYCMSELKDPLYFPDNIAEVVGDQTEKVTAVGKRYEKLYFFTERHIYSMSYSFSEESGASFTVAEINSPVGCTMPKTVQSIDNTLVFADKTSGVYILQSTDIFDELNVKHISHNITKSGDCAFADEGVFCSCDFDRKYYIFSGRYLFVWDYGKSPYYSSGDHKKAEERLSWYKIDAGDDCKELIPFGKTLLVIKGVDNASLNVLDRTLGTDTTYSDDGAPQSNKYLCGFVTKEYNMDIAYSKKTLSQFSFDFIKKTDRAKLTLAFYGDGRRFFEISPDVSGQNGKIKLKIPSFSAHKFSVGFEITEGVIGVSNLIFYSKICERTKHNL